VTKKYTINWENDEPVSFEVDGVTYATLEEIPNESDRDKLGAMVNAAEADEAFDRSFAGFDREFDKEFQEAQKSSVQGEKIIVAIFTGVAILMLLIAGVASFLNFQKMGREVSAPGRVVEVVSRREYVNEQDRVYRDYYFPVVEFTAADGRTRRLEISEGSQTPAYETGENIVVLYNSDKPLEARIQSTGSDALMWILPGITGVLGFAFLGAVLVVRKFLLNDNEE
jgi:hypothetical protein